MEWIGIAWDTIILSPMINVLIVLSNFLFNNFGLTIIVLTVIIRLAMYPLTRKQLQSSKRMQDLQPKIAELRKKYGKDKQRLLQEQSALFKQSGVSPGGCLVPLLVQMPIWVALYQSIIRVLAIAPEDFLNLSRHLYSSWSTVFSQVPLESNFLWLNLAVPDPYFLLPILVGGTMWLTQKMTMPDVADSQQQTQSRMMLWMMPLMFGFLTLSFPSGLALYWVASNVITIVMQYYISGWGGLTPVVNRIMGIFGREPKKRIGYTEKASARKTSDAEVIKYSGSSQEEDIKHEDSGDKRQDSGRGYPTSLRSVRRKPRRSKGRGFKRR